MQQSPAAGEEGPGPLIRWGCCRSLEQLEPAPNTIVRERSKGDRVVPRPEAFDGKDGSPRKWTPTAAASVRNALHHEGPRIQTFASATVAVRGGTRHPDWVGSQWCGLQSGPRLREGRLVLTRSWLVYCGDVHFLSFKDCISAIGSCMRRDRQRGSRTAQVRQPTGSAAQSAIV